jgi:Insulinase (Peptidase family M16)/Peptidase M16 inactive domain
MAPLNNVLSSRRITIVSSSLSICWWLILLVLLLLLWTIQQAASIGSVEAFQPWCLWRRPGGGCCAPLCPNDNSSGSGGGGAAPHHVPASPPSTELPPTCDATSSSSSRYYYHVSSTTTTTTALTAVSPFSSMTAQETVKKQNMNHIDNDGSHDDDKNDDFLLDTVVVGGEVQQSTKKNDSTLLEKNEEESTLSLQQQQQQQQAVQDEQRRQLLMIFFATATAATSSSSGVLLRPANAVAAATTAGLVESGTTTLDSATTAGVAVQILADDDAIVKAPLDNRLYRAIALPENGLRILLCSDPSTNEAAVAMNVHVGATSDPATIPGLAHFTEHMLFLGTREYPLENSFEAFLSKTVGGMSNAYTDSEDTVYFFHMETASDRKLLQEGLSRFQSFFSAPLFTESATSRELNAIESEHAKNLQTDSFRSFQLEKLRANPAHPFAKFYTGNKYTLLDNTKVQGINLRQALIDFYTRYYSANQMTLAIVAPQSLDELQDLVASTTITSTSASQSSSSSSSFGKIPNRNNPPPPEQAWAYRVPPFSVSASSIPSFQHVVEAIPVQDLRQVDLSWPIVYASSEQARDVSYLYKTNTYVAHLLGHEGPNSLMSYLKRQGWANSSEFLTTIAYICLKLDNHSLCRQHRFALT